MKADYALTGLVLVCVAFDVYMGGSWAFLAAVGGLAAGLRIGTGHAR